MITNPFTSDTFSAIWSKHFNHSAPGIRFSFIKDLLFAKHKFLPLYSNLGRTHTKGIGYRIDNSSTKDLKGKVWLIYDVPTYFELQSLFHKDFEIKRIRQYPGYLAKFTEYKDLDSYLLATFDGKSRNKLRSYQKRLENNFNIHTKMYFGKISKDKYHDIFKCFRKLMENRFEIKKISNNNLDLDEWNFYKEVTYPMILEKKASLFVTYDGEKPIGIMLNFMSKDILFGAITVFNIEYSKYSVGSVNIMKLIEWCLINNIKALDFSKGYFDYKTRWANLVYDFEYHVLYDRNSFQAKFIAMILINYLRTKQYLRDKKVNELLHRMTFLIRR